MLIFGILFSFFLQKSTRIKTFLQKVGSPIFKIDYYLTDPNIYVWAYIYLEPELYAYWPTKINEDHSGPGFPKKKNRPQGQEAFQMY